MIASDSQIWTEMYNRDPLRTRLVKMTSQEAQIVSHPDNLTFEIELLPAAPGGIVVVALLPGAPRKIVHSNAYRTLDAFNKHMNETLRQSTVGDGEPLAGFCYIDHVFIVPRQPGKTNLLLQWARQISVYRAGDMQIRRTDDVPLLIATNGHSAIRAIYPLIAANGTHDTRYLAPDKIKWVTGASGASFVNIFSCETPLPPARPPVIVPLCATQVVNHRVRQVLPSDEIPPAHAGAGSSGGGERQGPYRPDDFSEEQMEDSVREFFSVGDKIAEADAIDQALVADIQHMYLSVSSIPLSARTPPTTDGEILASGATPPSSVRFTSDVRMHSPHRRTLVPVGLVPPEEHRLGGTGKPRVGVKPRNNNALCSLSGSGGGGGGGGIGDVDSSSEQ